MQSRPFCDFEINLIQLNMWQMKVKTQALQSRGEGGREGDRRVVALEVPFLKEVTENVHEN